MAFFNDLKKLFFGAKAVTQSAADKAVEAGKEAGSELVETSGELWEKAKSAAQGLGERIAETADQAIDKASELAGGEKPKQDSAPAAEKTAETIETDDIMDAILAERAAASPAPAPLQEDIEEETLELPMLTTPAADAPKLLDDGKDDEPKLLDDGKDDEPGLLGSLNSAATSTGATVVEKSGEALDKAGDFMEGMGKKVLETGGEWADKFGEKATDIGGTLLQKGDKALDKAAGFTEEVGKKVLETGSRLTDKFGETAENMGEALFEKGGEAIDRAKGLASDLGAKILRAKDDLVARAQEEAEKQGSANDGLLDKLKGLNQKLEDKISGNNQPFADKTLHTGGSEFAKHDSFWEKADRFAKGDYHNQGDRPKPGELKIQDDPNFKPNDKSKDDENADGLIDDAIVES